MNNLLLLSGICNSVLGFTAINENVLLGIIGILSGILTVLISCLLAAFIIHLANHDSKAVPAQVCNANMKRIEELIKCLEREITKNV